MSIEQQIEKLEMRDLQDSKRKANKSLAMNQNQQLEEFQNKQEHQELPSVLISVAWKEDSPNFLD